MKKWGQGIASQALVALYSPECVEEEFSEIQTKPLPLRLVDITQQVMCEGSRCLAYPSKGYEYNL
jgi:hypothetical protein